MATEETKKVESIKFNNQTFISSYIDEIQDVINASKEPQFLYNNIYKLDTVQKSLPETLALLNGKSESLKFSKLESFQYSALVPKIRLFRVQQDNREYEFVFGKDTKYNALSDVSSLFTTPKGANGGIKSFEFKIAGTNPVTAEKQIEATLDLFFDSINSFSGGDYDKMLEFWLNNSSFGNNNFDNDSNFTTTNYWSLLFHPSLKASNNQYDTQFFRIKAIVGWEDLEENLKNELFSSFENIQEEIREDLTLSMYLNLVNHEFQFNEDGSIGLRLTYISSIENSILNEKYDLLSGLKDELQQVKNKTFSNTTLESELLKIQLLNYLKQNDINKLKKEIDTCGFNFEPLSSFINEVKDINQAALERAIINQNEKLINIQTQIDLEAINIKRKYYSALVDKLINLQSIKQTNPISKNTVQNWVSWKNNLLQDKPNIENELNIQNNSASNLTDKSLFLRDSFQERTKIKQDLITQTQGGFTLNNILDVVEDRYTDYVKTTEEKIQEAEQEITGKTILFTTVGSIIESALQIINDKLKEKNQDTSEFERNKIVFCNYSGNKNIADIPVALTLLREFLIKNIIEPQKESYSLYSLVQGLINEVIETALNSRDGDDKINKYSNTSLAISIITLQGDSTNPFEQFKTNNIVSFIGKTKRDLKQYYIYNKLKQDKKYYTYYIIYDKYNKEFNGIGDKIQDEKKGIYHFTVAQNYGLIRSINFKRVDQPFLKEAKSVGKQTFFLGQLREIYNVDIAMVGNTIFIPGMILFVKPSVEMKNPASENSFSQITGVGGYYTVIRVSTRISDGEYITSLECIFHSNGDKSQKLDQEGCNFDELIKAGIIKPDGNASIIFDELRNLQQDIKSAKTTQSITENVAQQQLRFKR